MSYSADTWLWPITLTPGTDNVIVVTEDPAGVPNVVTVTLHQDTSSTAAETWWMHDDTSFHSSRPGLLYALQRLLNDGTTVGCGTVSGTPTYTYSWEVIDPASSTGCYDNGLRLKATAPASDFEITWTSASTTIDATLFGSTLASPISDDLSATSGSDEVIDFPYCAKHRLVTRDLLSPNGQAGGGIAISKERYNYKDQQRSSSRPKDSVSVVWDEGFFRVIDYQDVVACDVHEKRAREAAWAAVIGRATNDTYSTWWDVWDALTNDDEVIVVHNTSSDLQVDANDYEVCKLWAELSWEQMAARTSLAGGLYDISVPLWVNPSFANYDH